MEKCNHQRPIRQMIPEFLLKSMMAAAGVLLEYYTAEKSKNYNLCVITQKLSPLDMSIPTILRRCGLGRWAEWTSNYVG